MLEEDFETTVKVVIVGNGAVGKSSMIQQYCKGIFTRDYKKTIGVDFLEKQIQLDDSDVRLMLWDTAGQEEFGAITKAYYRGAQACVLVFSTTDRDSFDAIESWKSKIEDEVGTSIPLVLVQNKIDLLDDAVVQQDEADALAKRLKLRFYRTSVKENFNVNEVFKYLAEKHIQKIQKEMSQEQETPAPTRQIGLFNTSGDAGDQPGKHKNGNTIVLGGNTETLQPNKSRTNTKSRNPFLRCKFF